MCIPRELGDRVIGRRVGGWDEGEQARYELCVPTCWTVMTLYSLHVCAQQCSLFTAVAAFLHVLQEAFHEQCQEQFRI